MKTFRKRFFGVALICVFVVGIYTFLGIKGIFKVLAKEEEAKVLPLCKEKQFDLTPSFTIDPDTASNVYTVSTNRGNFELVSISKDVGLNNNANDPEQGLYIINSDSINAAKCKVGDSEQPWAYTNKNTISPGSPVYVRINSNCENSENVVLRFKLTGDTDDKCTLKRTVKDSNGKDVVETADIKFDVAFTMNDVSKYEMQEIKSPNKWYSSICTIIRSEDNSENNLAQERFKEKLGMSKKAIQKLMNKKYISLDSDKKGTRQYYTGIVPFCYDDSPVATNFSEKAVLKKIKRAIEQTYKKTQSVSDYTFDMNNAFDKAFVKSKYLAGGKIDKNGENSEMACVGKKNLKDDQQSGHCYKDNSKSKAISLKCDANTKQESRTSKGYNFSNLQSFYTYSEDKIYANYKYYRTGSNVVGGDRTALDNYTEETKEVCSRVCEEAVDVEYGPPVASKAGQCFEYRVKVTSRIKCVTELTDKNNDGVPDGTPDESMGLCYPAPFCTHLGRVGTMNGAGPNEDFEACVSKCDGGKYTQSCSTKCYNEVYGNGTNNLAISYDLKATQLATASTLNANYFISSPEEHHAWNIEGDGCTDPKNCAHYYVDVATKSIGYYGGFARWYYVHGNFKAITESRFGKNYGFYLDEGVMRKITDSGICGAECYYIPCGSGYYNQSDIDETVSRNSDEYENVVEKCNTLATCQTKTAEFTMSTSYNGKTIVFPSKGKSSVDTVESGDKKQFPTLKNCDTSSSSGSSSSSKSCASDSVLYDYDGCYKTPNNPDEDVYRDGDKFYQVEITYPGSWIKNKTQEISYKPQNEKTWTKQNQKFCLPFEAEDVNEDWWKWRMNKVSEDKKYYYESFDDVNKCSIIDQNALKSKTYDDYSDLMRSTKLKYNIKAVVENFGHFGWNFNVSCFYAVDDDSSSKKVKTKNDTSTNNSSSNDKCERTLNYSVRTVDLTNLFPSDDGSDLSDKNQVGRTPGFNWTSSASISTDKAKGTSYAVNPESLIKKIQNLGDKVFDDSDKYVDYYFHLTPEVLAKIREYNDRNDSYTTFNGEFLTSEDAVKKYGIVAYRSNLFYHNNASANNSDVVIGSEYVKAIGNIGCNNDGDGSSCEANN